MTTEWLAGWMSDLFIHWRTYVVRGVPSNQVRSSKGDIFLHNTRIKMPFRGGKEDETKMARTNGLHTGLDRTCMHLPLLYLNKFKKTDRQTDRPTRHYFIHLTNFVTCIWSLGGVMSSIDCTHFVGRYVRPTGDKIHSIPRPAAGGYLLCKKRRLCSFKNDIYPFCRSSCAHKFR